MKPFVIAALSLLALSACQDEPKKAAGGTAQGEVLPGAASDAMLPLDTLKSQAPLAPKTEGGEPGDAKEPKKAKAGTKPSDTASNSAAEVKQDASPSAEESPVTN